MKSDMSNVPNGFIGLEIYGVYIKGNQIVVLGEPKENDGHNCDFMQCGTLDHVLIRCEIPEWQANQFLESSK